MLLEAMRAEGMVRYGAPFATPSSSWDEVRRAQSALEARSDAQLYQSYRVEYKMRYSHEDMSETLLRLPGPMLQAVHPTPCRWSRLSQHLS